MNAENATRTVLTAKDSFIAIIADCIDTAIKNIWMSNLV
jgi:hypothetical protein